MNLNLPGIITRGAITVYGPDDAPIGSFLPGCYWVGAARLGQRCYADYTLNTTIRKDTWGSRDGPDLEHHLTAVNLTIHWQLLRTATAEVRIMTALDAIGDFKYGQRTLGDITGTGWNLIVNSLQALEAQGRIEKKRGLIKLAPHEKGRYW